MLLVGTKGVRSTVLGEGLARDEEDGAVSPLVHDAIG